MVKLRDSRVEHPRQEHHRGLVLKPAKVRQGLELILQPFLVVERILVRVAPGDSRHGVQPSGDERLGDARHVRVQHGRRLALEVGHGRDEPGPQREEVIDAAAGPLPRLQTRQRELGDELDPLLISIHRDELAELIIRLETTQ